MPKIGRNDPCPCGSGKKYKKCCASKDDAARSAELAAQAAERAAVQAAPDGTDGNQTSGGKAKAPAPGPKGAQPRKGPPPKRPSPIRKRAV